MKFTRRQCIDYLHLLIKIKTTDTGYAPIANC